MIKSFYKNIVFKYPFSILSILLCGIIFLGYYATKLEIDASAETLLIEDDKDLNFTRLIYKRYKMSDFLIITFSPNTKLLEQISLDTIENITKEVLNIQTVSDITSILNVPLLQSPVQDIASLMQGFKTLKSKNIDKDLVKEEFLSSELYKNNLVSSDFKTTAIIVNFDKDLKYLELLEKRNLFIKLQKNKTLNNEEKIQAQNITKEFKNYRDEKRLKDSQKIQDIRNILKKYKNKGTLFLGGVGMISSDLVTFVKHDLLTYGVSLVFLLIFILWFIFKKIIWVILPLSICFLSVIATAGLLGLFSWEVTIISSNFISLQLIITLSIVLHLIVRYIELSSIYTKTSQYKLILNTVLSKINPSFFAIITTIAGFASLILSEIKPVQNLGWMMSAGICISLLIAFLIFPALLVILGRIKLDKKKNQQFILISLCTNLVLKKNNKIFICSILLVLFSLTGASILIVENSFINYFKKDTQIYKSMKIIDEQLGGTTPLDIILTFPKEKQIQESKSDSEDDFDDFEDEFDKAQNDDQYWFTKDKMDLIIKVHNYLESLSEVGKVQSLATLLKLGKLLNKNEDLDSFKLALLYTKLPQKYKDIILGPYINIEHNQTRISLRIKDSNPTLRRNELIEKIKKDLKLIINNDEIKYDLSNLMIMYNNMLQSLFASQIASISLVLVLLLVMFYILFSSLKVALIALATNIIPISIIFGVMGWFNIPLDVMTITIAAISIGIGVDNTIHYIHRFKIEHKKDHNYQNAMIRSHQSIAYAMVYTSFVVIIGFSVLILSNLIPTVYFGLLTVLVMISILASALLLLPKLLIILKPYTE